MTAHSSVLVDGRLAPADAPVLHADDRGLRHGDGAFETMRAREGRIVGLERHLARLDATLRALQIAPPAPATLRAQAAQLIAANGLTRGESVVRLLVTGGRGAGPRRPSDGPPTVLWTSSPLAPAPAAVRVATCPSPPRTRPDLKSLAYLPHVLAGLASADEPLYVERGLALEGARWNLFARVAGEWRTPPADGRLLPGVARGVLLELAAAGRFAAREAEVPVDRIEAAFVTNALAPITPISHLDGAPLAAPTGLDALRARFEAAADAS